MEGNVTAMCILHGLTLRRASTANLAMKEDPALSAAVARLLNYLGDRDVVDEVKTVGNVAVQSWKSEEFRKCIRQMRIPGAVGH